MKNKSRSLVLGAMIAALYAAVTYFQNLILPGSATWAIQLRLSESLCVLAFFTPAAPAGLALGCLIFNLTYAGALPLDFLMGPLATYLAGKAMWHSRKWVFKDIPLPGLLAPALFNGLLVGWELTVCVGGGFIMNGGYVALGEAAVLLTFGSVLYTAITGRRLDKRLFP